LQYSFRLQAGLGLFDGNGGIFDDVKDVNDSELFWSQTLTFGYQPDAAEDADPGDERPLRGITAKRDGIYRGGVSVVYLEMARESAESTLAGGSSVQFKQNTYFAWLHGTAAHEIGHGPGDQSEAADHAELALMHPDGSALTSAPEFDFAPAAIKRFRGTKRWSQ
jgi:hypothetical protein